MTSDDFKKYFLLRKNVLVNNKIMGGRVSCLLEHSKNFEYIER